MLKQYEDLRSVAFILFQITILIICYIRGWYVAVYIIYGIDAILWMMSEMLVNRYKELTQEYKKRLSYYE